MTFVGQALPAVPDGTGGLNTVTTLEGKVIAKPETSDIASGLNAAGQVTVQSAAGTFLTDGKTVQRPANPASSQVIPGGNWVASNSNAAGQVVGSYYDSPGQTACRVDQRRKITQLQLGGPSSQANAVNASARWSGRRILPRPIRSAPYGGPTPNILYPGGTMKDLGTLGGTTSVANAINASGMVVGASAPAPSNSGYSWWYNSNPNASTHAFVSDGTKMLDLNSLISDQLNLTLNSAVAINAQGQILALGQAGTNYLENAYLLTPVDQPVPVTPTLAPEPGTLAILGLAAGAGWLRRRASGRRAVTPSDEDR